ncbi:sigma-K factor-processing regulatory protein BofA [Weizmannia acidilactici]|uniref:Sigma-K factor-processing regulatory protein BofA n=1 Tax=Weizmannia acidilactici TaxID=2607726 RepID=A0A5J4JA68_9BACI|nr:pro-sigmaK processing inhibitor BofA family protein [Weizmannia acidilactici]GER71702.1 sigma-K factor-processing regulatory protein BofA [Weizmannia acidilactici]GER75127.1 sigma-K factor-processing regulatory protein BofA [Weizmannia acidilactici]
MSSTVIIIAIVSLILLLLFSTALTKPLRWAGKLCIKAIIGAVLLFFLNQLGGRYGLHIPINLATVSVSGILGVPGIIGLAVIQTWILP